MWALKGCVEMWDTKPQGWMIQVAAEKICLPSLKTGKCRRSADRFPNTPVCVHEKLSAFASSLLWSPQNTGRFRQAKFVLYFFLIDTGYFSVTTKLWRNYALRQTRDMWYSAISKEPGVACWGTRNTELLRFTEMSDTQQSQAIDNPFPLRFRLSFICFSASTMPFTSQMCIPPCEVCVDLRWKGFGNADESMDSAFKPPTDLPVLSYRSGTLAKGQLNTYSDCTHTYSLRYS